MNNLYNPTYLSELLAGEWYVPPLEMWKFDTVAVSKKQCQAEEGKSVLFIALDENVLYKELEKQPNNVDWQKKLSGVIVQKPMAQLDKNIPQLVVKNSYRAMEIIAKTAISNLEERVAESPNVSDKTAEKPLSGEKLDQKQKVTQEKHSSSVKKTNLEPENVKKTIRKSTASKNTIRKGKVTNKLSTIVETEKKLIKKKSKQHYITKQAKEQTQPQKTSKQVKGETKSGRPSFRLEEITHFRDGKYTIMDDATKDTNMESMSKAIHAFREESQLYKGKKVAILGGFKIGNGDNAREHQNLVRALMESEIDLLFAYGNEMKHILEDLPYQMVGGHFNDPNRCAEAVVQFLFPGDVVLLKGDPEADDFKFILPQLKKQSHMKPSFQPKTLGNDLAHQHGAVTVDLSNNKTLSVVGDKNAIQKQGIGNILLLCLTFDQLSAGKVSLHDTVVVNRQAARENRSARSIKLRRGERIQLDTLLNAFIINDSPDAIIAVAAHLYGNSNRALKAIQQLAKQLSINPMAVKNVTGRKMAKDTQITTLDDMYKAAKYLFNRLPYELAVLKRTEMTFKNKTLPSRSNLLSLELVGYSFMFGRNRSMGVACTMKGKQKLVTLVLGARDAFHRDYVVIKSLNETLHKEQHGTASDNMRSKPENGDKSKGNTSIHKVETPFFTMNVLGDTYFGEYYTDIRKKRNMKDALTMHGYQYSFSGIRHILNKGNMNIANFEATLSKSKQSKLKPRKPFSLYASPKETVDALQKEGIHAVTLGNNHAMDFGADGLERTMRSFSEAGISTFGAGANAVEAEKPFILQINNRRITCFSAYWYRNAMYRRYHGYATDVTPGVACLSGGLVDRVREEKIRYPNSTIIVFAHWGFDFKRVHQIQKRYARVLVDAGADLIIGHGAHMMQGIEHIKGKWVVYNLGNGIFNSNGEYQRRHVPPYGFIAQLQFADNEDKLKLYPIYSDNLETFWKPVPLDAGQFEHLLKIQQTFGTEVSSKGKITPDEDNCGKFLELKL